MCDQVMDYTLEIDYRRFTILEMKTVLKMLYHSSSFCYEDIYLLGEYMIERMDHLGVSLREKENKGLVELVVDTFNTLKKIHMEVGDSSRIILYNIREKFNYYMFSELTESPATSPVRSPCTNAPVIDPTGETKESIPKKMKKAFRRS